jgi:TolB-like protein/tetratricopeptide (TPR) repeat protein
MGPTADSGAKFKFHNFELDIRSGELRRDGRIVKLQLQPFKVLALLVSRAGQVITRGEICRHVWGKDTFVDYEQGLNYCIRQIRAALGGEEAKIYVETLPRRGYRFLVPVQESSFDEPWFARRLTLAVLPLENLSGNQEHEYFADGLTEEIITMLSSLSPEQLGVIARTSAMQYKRTTKRIDQIGRELDADYIVEGAVRRDGNKVRITAQLIRVTDQTHVWANSYERQLKDVLVLQSELASAIATAVEVQLDAMPKSGLLSKRLVDPGAYEACLRARFYWNRRMREDLYRALELFAGSIEKDPQYAPAFAGLADTYLVLLDYRYIAPREGLAMATAAAVNALRLDDRLADAHTSLAHARFHSLDWEGAERGFQRAIQIGSGYSLAHFYHANFLCARGHFEDAIAEAREAVRLDPLSMMAKSNLAGLYYVAGQYDEALNICRKALQLDPHLARGYEDLGRILLQKHAWSEAIEALEKAVFLSDRSARFLSGLAYGYGVAGRKELAREILVELTEVSKQRYIASSDFALVHAGLGECDQAIQWLEKAYEERDSHAPFLHVDPRLASLRENVRFQSLLKDAGLSL